MINSIKQKIGVIILIISILASAIPIEAKSLVKVKELEPNIVYYYDLDKDGKKEKIYYVISPVETEKYYDSYIVKLYINDKLSYNSIQDNAYTVDSSGKGFSRYSPYKIMDLNTKDKSLDLLLSMLGENTFQDYQAFQRYSNNKIKTIASSTAGKVYEQKSGYNVLDRDYAFRVTGVDGSGNFNLDLNNPYGALFGMYHGYIKMEAKNGKIRKRSKAKHPIVYIYKKYQSNKMARSVKLYKKASRSSKVIKTLKKGEKISILKVKPQYSKKYKSYMVEYAYAKTSSGKKGWIYIGEDLDRNQALFTDIRGWG